MSCGKCSFCWSEICDCGIFSCRACPVLAVITNRGSYRSAHVLLNLLNELRKNLIIQEHEFNLSYDIKITLISLFLYKNVIILSLCKQRCYGRHNVFVKSVNQ